MYPADQPGYSTASPISVPDESKSATNTSHRVSSSPNVTSSSVVQPGEPQPDVEPPVPVLNEKSQPEHAPHSRKLGVSLPCQETFGSARDWINKWLFGNHSSNLMFSNQSYPKLLEELSINQTKGDHLFPFVAGFANIFATNALPKSSQELVS